MQRLWKLDVAVYPPNDARPHYCVEVFETVRLARSNRVMHFSIGNPPTEADIDQVLDVLELQVKSLLGRTIGTQRVLDI